MFDFYDFVIYYGRRLSIAVINRSCIFFFFMKQV